MNWNEIIEKITPYIVKIETPRGYGTGFLCMYSGNKVVCGIATALHVVRHAADWQQPLKITHYASKKTVMFNQEDRIIVSNPKTDSAVILMEKGLHFPSKTIPLLPASKQLLTGEEIGWLGFPNIEEDALCFFSGRVSSRKNSNYLIDGIALHGVSGGPVFWENEEEIQIVGIVSAYVFDPEGQRISHGLLYAQDVSYFHEVVKNAESIKETKKKEMEELMAK